MSRVSPAGSAGAGTQRASAPPMPSSVWPADSPIELDVTWPPSFMAKFVSSFSEPDEHVVLATWPGMSEPGADLDEARHVVERLGRTASTEHVLQPEHASEPNRPQETTSEYADLVITSAHPQWIDDLSSERLALFAARRLRTGGVLVVLTHCDWTSGELTDPTGQLVTSAQNADLLYLQHVVALHAPVRNGVLLLPADHFADTSGNDAEHRAQHRAEVRGLPAPHRRIHSDVLLFAQPHDRRPARADQSGEGR
ncbi:hypothetical protein JNUCC0626_48450 [Lentzea sp. JNUCC 0626]|uniref:hypothetical protein n=1 Tax=Lentzea sp. JNUCC 0626 TaxID=3367513 RepID=UPI003749ABD9